MQTAAGFFLRLFLRRVAADNCRPDQAQRVEGSAHDRKKYDQIGVKIPRLRSG